MKHCSQISLAAPHGLGTRNSGFTLIEMAVVIIVLAVLTSLAAPSFFNLIRTQRVKSAANDLMSSLAFARSEAVKRNADVTIARVGSSWTNGWTVTYVSGGTQTARVHSALQNLSVTTSVTSLVFGGGGRADATATFTVDSSPQVSAVTARCIEVKVDGVPRSWVERGGNHDCTDD